MIECRFLGISTSDTGNNTSQLVLINSALGLKLLICEQCFSTNIDTSITWSSPSIIKVNDWNNKQASPHTAESRQCQKPSDGWSIKYPNSSHLKKCMNAKEGQREGKTEGLYENTNKTSAFFCTIFMKNWEFATKKKHSSKRRHSGILHEWDI